MPDGSAVPLGARAYRLAEGPVWDERSGRVLWVDIEAGEVWSARWPDLEDQRLEHRAPRHAPFVQLREAGGLVVGETNRIARISPEGAVERGAPLFADDGRRRLNDAACDPQGRVLVGTLSQPASEPDEQLFRIEPSGEATVLRSGLSLSNGIGFSPAGDLMHHADTLRRSVSTWNYATPIPTLRSEFIVEDGYPDGLCVDAEGLIWVAIWGGSEVRRYDLGGRVAGRVAVQALNVSSVAFVGPRLNSLLITSAAAEEAQPRARHPQFDGYLFVADVEVPGLRVHGAA